MRRFGTAGVVPPLMRVAPRPSGLFDWATGLRWRARGWEGRRRAEAMQVGKADGASVCALALT